MKTKLAHLRRGFIQTFALAASAAVAVCAIIAPRVNAQSSTPRIASELTGAGQAVVKNSQHPLAQAQFESGRMAADARLNGVTIVFSRSATQEANLKALIAEQQSPASPLYHRWLTPDQFAARFGMSESDLSKVEGWLQRQGFSIDSVARSKNAIHFSGTVRQLESAFSTEMHYYKINGTQHFAPSTALSVPSELAPAVLAVRNLDDFRPRPHVILRKNMKPRSNFTGAGSTNADNEIILFAPGDIATAYDVKPLYSASVTGAGQSITVVGQSAIAVSDIENFENAAGLTVKDPSQFVVPASGTPIAQVTGDQAESDLDVEWSGAMAPGATINFVYTGNNSNYGAFDALQYAIDEQIGTIISSSYGTCEVALGGQTLESSLEQGTSQGQTLIAAAGDDGSTDCYGITGLTDAQQVALAVDYPASSQYVTGLGGTEINQSNATYSTVGDGYWQSDSGTTDIVNSVLQYIPESVWNDDSSQYGLSATGGGASSLFTKPSWQTGVPGIPSDGQRDVPDLALYGSPNFPGYLLCSSDTSAWSSSQQSSCSSGFEDSSSGDLTAAGGTSFDAPIFAGILALINQKQGYDTGQGLINPTLYTLAADSTTYASAFHDITSGNNDCSAGSVYCGSTTTGFSAGTGYDQVSGLGSLDATNLAMAWPTSTSTTTLTPTTTTVTASNAGPSVGASDTFTISVAATSGTPTGTISLTVDTNTAIIETLASNGTYVYTATFSTAGAHTILATYGATTTYASSAGSVTVNVMTVSSGSGKIAVASSPTTLTVAQGSSGSEAITITPSGGYTGTVDLTFDTSNDSALQNLCYSFTNTNSSGDGTAAVPGTAPVTTQLTLDANAADCSTNAAFRPGAKLPLRRIHSGNTIARSSGTNPSRKPGNNPLPMTVALAGLVVVGFMGRASRRLRGLAALVLLASVGLIVTACGGSINNTLANPPIGNYTITVTGQDSATATITGTTTFTLSIN